MRARFVPGLFAATLAIVASELAGQQITTLTRKTGSATEPFSNVAAVRELPDGRVLVTDFKERTLSIVSFTDGAVRQLGRNGSGPNEYSTAQYLFPGRADTTYLFDFPARRMLRIAPNGTLAETVLLEFTIADTLSGEKLRGDRIVSGFRARDATGGFFYEVSYIEQGKGVHPDKSVARYDPATKTSKRVASIQGWYPDHSSRWRAPFMYQDVWAVASDGRVARVVPTDYHVEWYKDGALIARGPANAITAVRVTKDDRDAWYRARATQGSGRATLAGPPSTESETKRITVPRPPGFTDADFPAAKPPFIEDFVGRSALITDDGELWVARATAFGSTTALADVFDSSGMLTRRVSFPATHRVAGFGKGVVFLVRTDDDGLQWLERYAR